MSIEIRSIGKRVGSFVVLEDVNLHVPVGELVALLGPSGCGKTTLLRIIAGMESADCGQVLYAGRRRRTCMPAIARSASSFSTTPRFATCQWSRTLLSDYAASRQSSVPPSPRSGGVLKNCRNWFSLTGLPVAIRRNFRVASVSALPWRALAVEPGVLLLDEPFSALDTKVRRALRRWLRRLYDELHVSSVFVTHDQEEGLEVADPVVVMNRGRIEQIGTPDEADSSPASPIIFQFLGSVNVVHRRLHGAWAEVGGAHGDAAADAEATALVRPHDFDIERHPLPGSLQADVQEVHAIGPLVRVELAHASELIEVELARERAAVLALARGQPVWLKPRQVRVFATPATTLEERGSGL